MSTTNAAVLWLSYPSESMLLPPSGGAQRKQFSWGVQVNMLRTQIRFDITKNQQKILCDPY